MRRTRRHQMQGFANSVIIVIIITTTTVIIIICGWQWHYFPYWYIPTWCICWVTIYLCHNHHHHVMLGSANNLIVTIIYQGPEKWKHQMHTGANTLIVFTETWLSPYEILPSRSLNKVQSESSSWLTTVNFIIIIVTKCWVLQII